MASHSGIPQTASNAGPRDSGSPDLRIVSGLSRLISKLLLLVTNPAQLRDRVSLATSSLVLLARQAYSSVWWVRAEMNILDRLSGDLDIDLAEFDRFLISILAAV